MDNQVSRFQSARILSQQVSFGKYGGEKSASSDAVVQSFVLGFGHHDSCLKFRPVRLFAAVPLAGERKRKRPNPQWRIPSG